MAGHCSLFHDRFFIVRQFLSNTIRHNGLQRDHQPLALCASVDFRNCHLIFCGQVSLYSIDSIGVLTIAKAFRCDWRSLLAHRWPPTHGHCWIYSCNVYYEYGCSLSVTVRIIFLAVLFHGLTCTMKILYDTVISCLCDLYDLGLEYLFPIAVEARCSHRTSELDGDTWQRWFIVSSQATSYFMLLLTLSQVLLAIPLGAFICELISHLHLDKRYMYCNVLGI